MILGAEHVTLCLFIQGATRLLADLEGDIKRKYFGYCFIIFINLQYKSQFFSLRFENNIGKMATLNAIHLLECCSSSAL